jgi:glucosamine--fructose-6-phosphate aminotransferase (isomerizing)
MCGIIGYIGGQPALPVILDGLRRLEYRGYDSAGVALVRAGGLERRRTAGKLARLEESLDLESVEGDYGVGHTRWATHGRPTEENAHPHVDCTGRLVVVHNGIIENYLDLKRELEREGHTFVTETDTETIAHLVEREMRDDGLAGAVRRALAALEGLFALVVVSADDPGTIVTARSGPPIVIGVGDGEYLVASDIPAVLSHTRDIVFLGDREMAVVRRDGATYSDFEGAPRPLEPQRVAWDAVMAEKAGYKHFMQKEIFEQPDAIQETLLGRISLEAGDVFPGELGIAEEALRRIERVAIVACGTSWHAGLVGKFLFEQLARLPVDVDYGSEYRYRDPIIDDRTLAIVITQSGETADTLAALREAKAKNASSIAICNVVGSMVTREADGTVYTHAGPEIGVASTKAFTSQLVALHLLALHLGRLRGALAPDLARPHLEALAQLPRLVEATLKLNPVIEQIAGRFYKRTDFLYLGRSVNYPIALEGALKLKEISYIHAEGYPAGEMKHGPIALIDENVPVVALAPHDHVFEKMTSNLHEAKARGSTVIAITDGDAGRLGEMLDRADDHVLTIPRTHPLLTPVLLVVPLQLLAYHIAVHRGCDVDQPRNLAKSVTVE